MRSLHELALKYGSDKAEHGYMDFYENTFPKNPKRLLEIGVKQGASIRIWREYFPDCEVHGLDLFEEFPIPDIPGVTWHKGNQCDHLLLEELRKFDFDVIIDDGSHIARHQMMTFYGLYTGKPYYIEDIHCNHNPFYLETLPYAVTPDCMVETTQTIIIRTNAPIVLIKRAPNAFEPK